MTQEEFEADLKAIAVEGARRMQNVIVSLLATSGYMDVAPKVLALDPVEACGGKTLTLDNRTGR